MIFYSSPFSCLALSKGFKQATNAQSCHQTFAYAWVFFVAGLRNIPEAVSLTFGSLVCLLDGYDWQNLQIGVVPSDENNPDL